MARLKRSNHVYIMDGGYKLLWNGDYFPISREDAEQFTAQNDTLLEMLTKNLTGNSLDWAGALALGYTPHLAVDEIPGKHVGSGQWQYDYEDYVTIAHFIRHTKFGTFRPSTDYAQGGPLLDEHRISTEIAGDGWAALYNDCFDQTTNYKAMQGTTRLQAGLRCLVMHFLGDKVRIPAEMVDMNTRLAHIRKMANA